MRPCAYILANGKNGTLYTGVTNDLPRRVCEHKTDAIAGFTKRYGVHTLVYAEFHDTMPLAIEREKQIKRSRRDWKIALIEKENPARRDLYDDLNL